MVNKVVFILFFQGDQLRTRVRKICEGYVPPLSQTIIKSNQILSEQHLF